VIRPNIAVLDYGIGNLRSAQKALQRVGGNAELVTTAAEADAADAVVLPGVGAFGACMDALDASGLADVTRSAVASGKPFLGICVGMQLLFDGSEELPGRAGLGLIPGMVRWLPTDVKRPQMQWNRLGIARGAESDPMLQGLGDDPWMYFVHSLHGMPTDPSVIAATCDYGTSVTAAIRKGNMFATQFHPEKSATCGLALLANFVRSAT
jgi:imidazole glycerol-phosphate synthase subunit HisH